MKPLYAPQHDKARKRGARKPSGPTPEAKLRAMGAYSRGREWFRLDSQGGSQ